VQHWIALPAYEEDDESCVLRVMGKIFCAGKRESGAFLRLQFEKGINSATLAR